MSPRQVAGLGLLAAVPFVVAAIALHGRPWFPTGDLAQAEMRMRDFWSHPPLVGAAGRITTGTVQGSHPGPLMFWAAYPVYALFGRTAWAFEAACAALNVLWVLLIAWAASRRGGLGLVLAVLGVTALASQSFGMSALTQPWNPYTPLLVFLLFLVLVWGVLCDDLALLPLAVVAGSYCIQCHVSYAGVVGLLLGVAVLWQVVTWWRARGAEPRPRLPRWVLIGVVVGVLAWLPPLIQQLTEDPGNVWITYRYFRYPPEQAIGWAHGLRLTLLQLNPWGSWVSGTWVTTGSVLPGLVLLVAWVAGAVATWREDPRLARLHVVAAVALLSAVISSARIFGEVWGYLVEWMWCITALIVVAVFWSAALIVRRSRVALDRRIVLALPALMLLAGVGLGVVDALRVQVPSPRISHQEDVISRQTLTKVSAAHRYLVDWNDPIGLGGTGFGLMLELERHGIVTGTLPAYGTGVRQHRVMQPGDYDRILHVVTGYSTLLWRHDPAGTEIACVDLRTREERLESQRLEAELVADLRARGLDTVADAVRSNLLAVFFVPDLPPEDAARAKRILALMETVTVVETPAANPLVSRQAIAEVEALPARDQLGTSVTCDRR